MSLDFYLESKKKTISRCICRECGDEHSYKSRDSLFETGITHNLTDMAAAAGIYKCLWHPYDNGYKKAKHIIKKLEKGLSLLKEKPDFFKQYNSSNGWGLYKDFVPFVQECLEACKKYPNAIISTST